MAKIQNFEYEERNIKDQEIVKTTYSLSSVNDERVFQINTYGRSTRIIEGNPSQIIQFNKTTAIELIKILKKEFKINN